MTDKKYYGGVAWFLLRRRKKGKLKRSMWRVVKKIGYCVIAFAPLAMCVFS
jgi:hypothetical protein